MEGLNDGVYVGQRSETVLWLVGSDPRAWTVRETGGAAPFPGTSTVIEADLLDPALKIQSSTVAIWLSENGYCIGLQEGTLVAPQAKRIRLAVTAAGSLAVVDRRFCPWSTERRIH